MSEMRNYTFDELRFDSVTQIEPTTYIDVSARATRYRIIVTDVSNVMGLGCRWLVAVVNHPVPVLLVPNLDMHWTYVVEKMRDPHVGQVVALALDHLASYVFS